MNIEGTPYDTLPRKDGNHLAALSLITDFVYPSLCAREIPYNR
ncbi:hypothetical protein C725_1215 [Pacificimonas flava]|uniref:Uncharacterized protein n=1 Tax=Pacificimonas flava TaxID=1234595 RepID=M2T9Q9_9SPHN|nr:hypothetical protein C725_1215 [Pacificimonas flava]